MHWAPTKNEILSLRVVWAQRYNTVQEETYGTVISICWFVCFHRPKGNRDQIFVISTETQNKTKTHSDLNNSDICECLHYPVSSLKAGIIPSSFLCFLNAWYMCYIYLIEFTPSWEEAITSTYRLAFKGRVHVPSA